MSKGNKLWIKKKFVDIYIFFFEKNLFFVFFFLHKAYSTKGVFVTSSFLIFFFDILPIPITNYTSKIELNRCRELENFH